MNLILGISIYLTSKSFLTNKMLKFISKKTKLFTAFKNIKG